MRRVFFIIFFFGSSVINISTANEKTLFKSDDGHILQSINRFPRWTSQDIPGIIFRGRIFIKRPRQGENFGSYDPGSLHGFPPYGLFGNFKQLNPSWEGGNNVPGGNKPLSNKENSEQGLFGDDDGGLSSENRPENRPNINQPILFENDRDGPSRPNEPVVEQVQSSNPVGINQPPSNLGGNWNQPPINQGGNSNQPPLNQGVDWNQPPINQGSNSNQPPSNQGVHWNQPPINQGGNWNRPPSNQGGNWNQPPINQGGNWNQPPINQGGNWNQPPINQGDNWSQPPINQGGNRPPINQGSNWNQPPINQGSNWNQPPTNQGSNWNQPPINQGSNWNQPPINQGGNWNQPPINQGGNWNQPPLNQGGDWNQPSINQGSPSAESTTVNPIQPHTTTLIPPPPSTSPSPCEMMCPVTPEFNPVCGSDGYNYGNSGRLKCAQTCGKNVTLNHFGNCIRRSSKVRPTRSQYGIISKQPKQYKN